MENITVIKNEDEKNRNAEIYKKADSSKKYDVQVGNGKVKHIVVNTYPNGVKKSHLAGITKNGKLIYGSNK